MNAVKIIYGAENSNQIIRAFELSAERTSFWIDGRNLLDFKHLSTVPDVIVIDGLKRINIERITAIISAALMQYKKIYHSDDTEITRPEIIITTSELAEEDFPAGEHITFENIAS